MVMDSKMVKKLIRTTQTQMTLTPMAMVRMMPIMTMMV